MNSLLRASFLFLTILTTMALAAVPTITDPTATGQANGAAELTAKITTGGSNTTVTFRLSLAADFSNSQTKVVVVNDPATDQLTTVNFTNLIGGQTYHTRVEATNTDGAATTTADITFVEPAETPVLDVTDVEVLSSTQVKLTGTVSANGTTGGKVYFQYGTSDNYGLKTASIAVAPGDMDREIVATISGLTPGTEYHFRFAFEDSNGDIDETVSTSDDTFQTDEKETEAKNDRVTLIGRDPIVIDVLANDVVADGSTLTLTAVTAPQHGTAVIVGDLITYTPNASFQKTDTFTYTAEDENNQAFTATVTIVSAQGALAGTHGGFIKNPEGKEIGFFRLTATENGVFTGAIFIDGQRYPISGTFSADGKFHGLAYGGGETIYVELQIGQGEGATSLTAKINGGAYTGELGVGADEAAERGVLAGRYTVELPGGGGATTTDGTDGSSTTDTSGAVFPEGSGWAAIRVSPDGNVKIKGRLPDGRKFSTPGILGLFDSAPAIAFYDDLEDTRVVGIFTPTSDGSALTGTFQVDRASSDDEFFPRGFDSVATVNGARYVPPADGDRVLGGGDDYTVTFSGGGYDGSLTRRLHLSDDDKVTVLDSSPEALKVSIDRGSGRFQTKFKNDPQDGKYLKGTGVFIQDTDGGTGVGQFKGISQTGKISIGVTTNTTTIPTPDPNVVDPGVIDPGVIVDPVAAKR